MKTIDERQVFKNLVAERIVEIRPTLWKMTAKALIEEYPHHFDDVVGLYSEVRTVAKDIVDEFEKDMGIVESELLLADLKTDWLEAQNNDHDIVYAMNEVYFKYSKSTNPEILAYMREQNIEEYE